MNRYIKRKAKLPKIGSLSFFLSIPVNLTISILAFISLVLLLKGSEINTVNWMLFGAGFISSLTIVAGTKLHKLRTFIHELKHAVVVVMTGNRMRDFKVKTHTGHVEYALYSNKLHFAPLITIAPYFLPLFSTPILISCIFLDASFFNILCPLLGAALAADIILGFQEIHPNQTDIKKTFGGIIMVGLFIVSFQLMWCSLCLLWVSGGRKNLIFAGETSLEIIKALAEIVVDILPSL